MKTIGQLFSLGWPKGGHVCLMGGAPLIEVSLYRIYNKFWDFNNWVFHRGCTLNRWPLKGGTTIFMVVWVPLGFVVYCLSHNSHYTVDNFPCFHLYSWFSSGTLFNLDIKKGHGTDKINTFVTTRLLHYTLVYWHSLSAGTKMEDSLLQCWMCVKNPHNVLYIFWRWCTPVNDQLLK